MGKLKEKRSSEHGNGDQQAHQADLFHRVGGRQASPTPPAGGGGYQNICTVLNFDPSTTEKKRDPRLEEMRQMGLQRVWLDVAETIGVDDFLKVWRIIDSEEVGIVTKGRRLVPIRTYKSFLQYQRNRYIESLVNMGHNPREIQEILKSQLCEQISIRHISRLARSD